MYKMAKLLAFILILVFTAIFLFRRPKTINLKINNQTYRLEVASSILQKAKGLSGRNSLCSDCGMIFPFSDENIHPFWMKDTLIPLDIIWVDSQGRVVTVLTGQPNDLSVLQNTSPAKYVIELNAGDTQKLNLKVDDTIYIPRTL